MKNPSLQKGTKMEHEVIETVEETEETDSATNLVAQVVVIAALSYAGWRLGKLTEHLITTAIEHHREKKVAKKNEK